MIIDLVELENVIVLKFKNFFVDVFIVVFDKVFIDI